MISYENFFILSFKLLFLIKVHIWFGLSKVSIFKDYNFVPIMDIKSFVCLRRIVFK